MKLKRSLLMVGLAAAVCMSTGSLLAQDGGGGGGGRRQGGGGGGGGFGGGNFDPAEFQRIRLERIREQMAVNDDAEWKAIEGRITKVFEAQQAMGGFRGGFGRGRGGGGGGGGGRGGNNSPELDSLRAAIENNAPAEQVKAALEKYRAARKVREDALAKAQDDLKKVLSVKQEAVAVTNGLLN